MNNKFDLILRFLEIVKEKPSWKIDELCHLLNINNEEFEYIVSTLSQIYISNDFDLFLDIEINNEKIDIDLSDVVIDTQFITDYELLSMYKFLIGSDIKYLEHFIPKIHLLNFKNILSKHISIKDDTLYEKVKDERGVFEYEELIIEYSPLGTISSSNYHIKPISLLKNHEGVVLLAQDLKANKLKTFLIHRILNTSEDIYQFDSPDASLKEKEYTLTFKYLNNNTLLPGIDSSLILKNKIGDYSIRFRNRSIALEFYKKNIYMIKVVDDIGINAEIKSSFRKVINLVNLLN